MDWRLKYVQKCAESFLTDYKDLFYKRHKEGFVKDGHGDLRAEHLFFSDDGIQLIDCIEFNERFRTNDVVNEAAFLSMEFDYLNAIELSDAFLKGFFQYYNTPDSLFLLNFYRCYRAVVRAKVAMFTLGSMDQLSPAHAEKMAEMHRLCDMAVLYAFTMRSITPLAFCGIIATGKSMHSKRLAKNFPVARHSTDEARKLAAGMEMEDSAVTQLEQGLYTDEISIATYAELGKLANADMKVGRLPLVDGTFSKVIYQNAFAEALGTEPSYVLFTAPDEVLKKRLANREDRKNVTDGRLHHFGDYKERAKNLPRPLFTVDTSEDRGIENIVQELIK
jgi:predicted kinase